MTTPCTRLAAVMTTLALAFLMAGHVAGQETSIVGSWEGELVIPDGGSLTLVYHVEVGSDGGLTGTLDSVDQAAIGIPLSTVSFMNGVLSAVAASIPGEPTFVGTLSDDGNTLSGTFVQGDGSSPLELTRREDPA